MCVCVTSVHTLNPELQSDDKLFTVYVRTPSIYTETWSGNKMYILLKDLGKYHK